MEMEFDKILGVVALCLVSWAGYNHYRALYNHYIKEIRNDDEWEEYFARRSEKIQFFHMIMFPITFFLLIIVNVLMWLPVE